MTPKNRWWKATGTMALVAVLVVASGCGKQRTNLNLNKFDKTATKARNFNVETHANAAYQGAVNQRNQAEQSMVGGNYKESVTQSREAVRSVKAALATAMEMEADVQRREADRDVGVMDTNEGNRENPELYQEIIELQEKMKEKYDKQRWVATIELADEIKKKIVRLLSRLRTLANDDLVKVEAESDRLIDEGGEQYAMIQVQRVRGTIVKIKENIAHPTKNYKKAIALSKEAIIDAQEGILESKKKRCEKWIDQIQKGLITAQQLRAEYFVPDLWNASSQDFANLVENFWKKEYDFVLSASRGLMAQVDNLIFETRKASANYQLRKLTVRLAELRSNGAEEYLPGRLAPIEQDLKVANEQFSRNEFPDVESTCQDGQLKASAVMADFGRLAEDWIRKGTELFNRAQSIAADMDRIFRAVPPKWGEKPQDQVIEDNKQAIKKDLTQRLADAQARVALANVKHTSEDYRDAIVLMKTVEDDATTVIKTIFKVVAHNVITEISDQITRYKGEGATELAKQEMADTEKLLAEAKQLRDEGKFQEANSKAADARAELERTISAIKVAVSVAIEDAQAELERSNETRTSQLQPDAYDRSVQYINDALVLAKGESLKDAVYTARRGNELIRQASRDAARIWAQQSIENAERGIAAAREAGMEIYAPQILNDAMEDLAQANKLMAAADALMGQEKYEEGADKLMQAKDLAVQAGEGADRAKYNLIDELEAAIVEARSYDAARHDLEGLTEAILTLNRSKDAMAAGQFDLSHELAMTGKEKMAKITAGAKNRSYNERLDLVDKLIEEAIGSGGRYFNPQLLASLARDVDKLRVQYESDRFDSNDKKVTEIEAHLQGLVDNMPDLVAQWLSHQKERLDEVAGGDLPPTYEPRVSEVRKYLRYAEMDFKRGKYRSSYSNLLRGRRLIDGLFSDEAEIVYRRQIRVVLDDLATALTDFDHFLSLRPQVLDGMTKGAWGDKQFIAIAGRMRPEEFRQRVDAMIVSIQAIKAPETMNYHHQGMKEMMDDARMAAIHYERLLVLSEYSPPQQREIIRKAYNLIEKVRNRRTELETTLLPQSVAKQKI